MVVMMVMISVMMISSNKAHTCQSILPSLDSGVNHKDQSCGAVVVPTLFQSRWWWCYWWICWWIWWWRWLWWPQSLKPLCSIVFSILKLSVISQTELKLSRSRAFVFRLFSAWQWKMSPTTSRSQQTPTYFAPPWFRHQVKCHPPTSVLKREFSETCGLDLEIRSRTT